MEQEQNLKFQKLYPFILIFYRQIAITILKMGAKKYYADQVHSDGNTHK